MADTPSSFVFLCGSKGWSTLVREPHRTATATPSERPSPQRLDFHVQTRSKTLEASLSHVSHPALQSYSRAFRSTSSSHAPPSSSFFVAAFVNNDTVTDHLQLFSSSE
jgi:hypothetical protein